MIWLLIPMITLIVYLWSPRHKGWVATHPSGCEKRCIGCGEERTEYMLWVTPPAPDWWETTKSGDGSCGPIPRTSNSMGDALMIFVFGSNEAGRHGKGAAHTAWQQHGAASGMGFGPSGSSFAIPTKDWRIQTLPVEDIAFYVRRFIIYARLNPNTQFQITALGTGLAGIPASAMAELFKYAPDNCLFDEAWQEFLPKKSFWGTYP